MPLPTTLAGRSQNAYYLAYDSFTRADAGSLGNTEPVGPLGGAVVRAWSTGAGSTWAIVSGEAVNTPSEGAELVTNGGMEAPYDDESAGGGGTVNVANNWNNLNCETDGTDTLDECTALFDPGGNGVTPHGGASCQYANVNAGTEGVWTAAGIFPTAALWYKAMAWVYPVSGTVRMSDSNAQFLKLSSGLGAWQQLLAIGRTAFDAAKLIVYSFGGAAEYYVDDVSAVQLTLNTLFSSVDIVSANVNAQAEVDTVVAATQAGLVLNLDSVAAPANFVIAYHDGTNAKLEKCVAGTYTSVISAAAAYVAGANIRVLKNGTSYSLYYNGVQVGITSTISDAGIVSNTRHGLFSTYSGNQLDNFQCVRV